MSELTARDKFKQELSDGGEQIVVEYFKRLATEDASIDDLRKGVELVAKAHGLSQADKQDTLMQVSWTINGGNLTIGVTNQPTPDADVVEMETPAVEAKSSPGEPDKPQTPAAALSFAVIDNMLDNIA